MAKFDSIRFLKLCVVAENVKEKGRKSKWGPLIMGINFLKLCLVKR